MYCWKCGTEFEGNFCPKCGTPSAVKMAADNQKRDEMPRQQNSNTNTYHLEGDKWVADNTVRSNERHEAQPAYTEPPKKKRRGKGCLVAFLIVILLYFWARGMKVRNGYDSGSQTYNTSTVESSVSQQEVTTETKADAQKETDAQVETININGAPPEGYVYITPADLQKYCANLSGQKIYTVIKVSDMKEGRIQSSLTDGFMMSSFNTVKDYMGQFKRDDVVGVYGEVDSSSTYFVGTSVNIINCDVFASGEYADTFIQDATDESLAEYLVVTPEVAKTLKDSQLTEDEFISLCESANYTDIMRNPDSYKDYLITVNGKVDQVIEGLLNTVNIYVIDSNGNKWACSYAYSEGESRILEGDRITIYGRCKGTSNAKTVTGQQVTMPQVDIRYYK